MMSCRIEVDQLWTGDHDDRRPISALDDEENWNIHARLRIWIGARQLPSMAHCGPDDVCLNDWCAVLLAVRRAFDRPDGVCAWDDAEQGQPRFVFHRHGARALLSIGAHPDWQKVFCPAEDLLQQIDRLVDDVFIMVREAARPEIAEAWIASVLEDSAAIAAHSPR